MHILIPRRARLELALLLLAIVIAVSALAVAVVAGELWFAVALVFAAAPVAVAWRLGPVRRTDAAIDTLDEPADDPLTPMLQAWQAEVRRG